LPTVTTGSITDITDNTATAGGEITDTGGGTVLKRGICVATTTNPDTTKLVFQDTAGGYTAEAFTKALTGLAPATTYHYRAFATNTTGTSYGDDSTFATTYAHTDTFYVFAGRGSDTNSGKSRTSAWATLAKLDTANVVAINGRAVVVIDSIFTEDMTVSKDSLTFIGDLGTSGSTTINGKVIIADKNNIAFESISFAGSDTLLKATGTNDSLLIRYCKFYDADSLGVLLQKGIGQRIYYNEIWFCGTQYGLLVNYTGDDSLGTFDIYNNTIAYNPSYGAGLLNGTVNFENNIVAFNDSLDWGTYEVKSDSNCTLTSDYNIFYQTTDATYINVYNGTPKTWTAWKALGRDSHSYSADPLFYDIYDDPPDFNITYGSPAIDMARSRGQTRDIDRNPIK
jgi:hypothetical protein